MRQSFTLKGLESKHYQIFEKAFELVLEGYKEEAKDYNPVMSRFKQVELRGRNKAKY